VPADVLAPKPRTLTHAESAALTMTGLSAWQGLFDHGALREGERVRVLGANGGVGHLAVQLAGDALAEADEPADLVFDTAGGDAFAEVLGARRRSLELRLALELLLERPGLRVVEEALRQGDAARRERRELGGTLGGPLGEPVCFDHLRDEPPRMRLGGGQPA